MNEERTFELLFFNNTKDIIVKPKLNPQHDQGQKVVYHD